MAQETRMAAPTLEEVAAYAGVSRSTASRAINGGARVSPDARDRVDAAIAALGYSPNRAARTLVTRRADSIALVVPEPDQRVLSDPFFAGVLTGVGNALEHTDLQLVLVIARPDGAARAVRYLRSGHVDGAIVVSHHRVDALDRVLAEASVPSVFVGRPMTTEHAVDYVDVDNVAGGYLAAHRLVGRGCRRIGTVAGPEDMAAGMDRLTGWRRALAEAGLPDDAVEVAAFTTESGAAAARRLFARHPDLDGVFVASDLMALGVLQVLDELGRSVPGDVAVVGYDNIGLAPASRPPLTTVIQPVSAMARAATERLLAQLAGGGMPGQPLVFEPELVVRDSA